MKALLYVFLGGGLGSMLRYLVGIYTASFTTSFPYGTFIVNIIGSFIIGIIFGLTLKNTSQSGDLILLLIIGFCGGFTTFSSFAFENYNFLKNGEITVFATYTIASIVLGLSAVFLGLWISKLF
ncbi:fluoride efflux transporter CrcB [Patiriisocius hiemis]|uniref:Fluoride-specific ion channel FluC n=1 Tax=Patiriisocius hiemis TaxID=3075604 RepID=A0ABU2YF39_9FLAO|nr:fluoride efflux transporter CrcB [Constantimarinum sp. W242]MDT0556786.1 fluoride efflux transporter CrcB [Constantimarinum sp. W242]